MFKRIKFYEYCFKERSQNHSTRTNYYSAVELDGKYVGVVGIHPVSYNKRPTMTFLSPLVSGKGVGKAAVSRCLHLFWSRHPNTEVMIDVRTDNDKMLHLVETKLGTDVGTKLRVKKQKQRVTIGTHAYVQFRVKNS